MEQDVSSSVFLEIIFVSFVETTSIKAMMQQTMFMEGIKTNKHFRLSLETNVVL